MSNWTKEEIKILKHLAPNHTAIEISNKLDRTPKAIHHKCKNLKINIKLARNPTVCIEDCINRKVNRLLILADAGKDNKGSLLVKCICDCGTILIRPAYLILSGQMKSCGCLKLENTIEAKRNHWEGKTYEKLRNDMQLRIYHYAAHHLFPQYENILVTINYINDGGPFTVFFSRSDIDVTLENIRKKYEAIRDIEIPKLTKSWKCTKLCFAGKSTFEDTNVLPLIEKRAGQRTPQGQIMTKCEQCKYVNQHRNIGAMMKNMSAPNYDINAYKDPGSI